MPALHILITAFRQREISLSSLVQAVPRPFEHAPEHRVLRGGDVAAHQRAGPARGVKQRAESQLAAVPQPLATPLPVPEPPATSVAPVIEFHRQSLPPARDRQALSAIESEANQIPTAAANPSRPVAQLNPAK